MIRKTCITNNKTRRHHRLGLNRVCSGPVKPQIKAPGQNCQLSDKLRAFCHSEFEFTLSWTCSFLPFSFTLTDFVLYLYSILVLYLSNAPKVSWDQVLFCFWAAGQIEITQFIWSQWNFWIKFVVKLYDWIFGRNQFFKPFKNKLSVPFLYLTNIWERCSLDWWESKGVVLSQSQTLTYYLNKDVSVWSIYWFSAVFQPVAFKVNEFEASVQVNCDLC